MTQLLALDSGWGWILFSNTWDGSFQLLSAPDLCPNHSSMLKSLLLTLSHTLCNLCSSLENDSSCCQEEERKHLQHYILHWNWIFMELPLEFRDKSLTPLIWPPLSKKGREETEYFSHWLWFQPLNQYLSRVANLFQTAEQCPHSMSRKKAIYIPFRFLVSHHSTCCYSCPSLNLCLHFNFSIDKFLLCFNWCDSGSGKDEWLLFHIKLVFHKGIWLDSIFHYLVWPLSDISDRTDSLKLHYFTQWLLTAFSGKLFR